MAMKSGSDINRLFAHIGLFQFGSCLAGVFFIALMLRRGVPPDMVFLAYGAIFALRFALRPLVIVLAKAVGLRGAMVAGAALSSLQYLTLPRVEGIDGWLAAWVATAAVGDVVYWTLFHVMFAAMGDQAKLGRQNAIRQVISAGASILGPPLGGFLLTRFDPTVAFTAAGVLRVASAFPLFDAVDPPFERQAPADAYRAGAFGALVFATDGWVICSAGLAWSMIAYLGLGERFDTLGLALALAGAVGALGGVALGRLVDLGHARRAVFLNLAAMSLVFAAQAAAGRNPAMIIAAMILAALLGGLSVPSMMPAVYVALQDAPCSLRFQFATEGGWDMGAIAASLTCAGLTALGAPLQVAILLAIPMLFAQAWLLVAKYKSRAQSPAASD